MSSRALSFYRAAYSFKKFNSRVIIFDDHYLQATAFIKYRWVGNLQTVVFPRNIMSRNLGVRNMFSEGDLRSVKINDSDIGLYTDYDGHWAKNVEDDIEYYLKSISDDAVISYKVLLPFGTDRKNITDKFSNLCIMNGFMPTITHEMEVFGSLEINAIIRKM